MKRSIIFFLSSILTLLFVSFKDEMYPRYFEHLGAGVAEISTTDNVSIGNNVVSFTNAKKNVVLLTAVDSIFTKNIVSLIPDSLKNDTFKLQHFAIPVGPKKFSIQPITPLIPGKWTGMTITKKPDDLFDKNHQYDGNKRRLGVFKLKDRPYFFMLLY